jgi:hypothetical protein
VLICHAADEWAIGEEGNVHSRKGQDRMHHVRGCGTNPEQSWNMPGPQSKVVGVKGGKLMVQRGDVVDQAQILNGIQVRKRSRVNCQRREREHASALPLPDCGLDLRCPHQIRLVGSGRALCIIGRNIVVGATDLVLGTVAALRKALVTSNMATFTGRWSVCKLRT